MKFDDRKYGDMMMPRYLGYQTYKEMVCNMYGIQRYKEDGSTYNQPRFEIGDMVVKTCGMGEGLEWKVNAILCHNHTSFCYDLTRPESGVTITNISESYLVPAKKEEKEKPVMDKRYKVKEILYHGPATIVYWADGEKTVVKCMEGDTFDPMAGFCAALAKRVYGSSGAVKQIIKASRYEESKALPFQSESVKDIATRAMGMLLADVMKGE